MSQPNIGHTPTPWTFRDASGAGLEICGPVYQMPAVDLPHGMPEAPIHIFQFTAPQIVQIAAERWVQFEPKGWSEMQEANAAFIVEAVNNYAAIRAKVDELTAALTGLTNCADGLSFRGDEVKAAIGITNWNVLQYWIEKGRKALAVHSQDQT